MDRKKITEWIKWIVWAGSLVGMFTAWRVDKAKTETEDRIFKETVLKELQEIKQDAKETKEYAFKNKDNLTRVTTILELMSD